MKSKQKTSVLNLDTEEAHAVLTSLGFQEPKAALKNLALLSKTPFSQYIETIVKSASNAPSPDGALNNLESITLCYDDETVKKVLKKPDNIKRLVTITGASTQLSNFIRKYTTSLSELLIDGGLYLTKKSAAFHTETLKATALCETQEEFEREIRTYRNKEYLRLGARDLLGLCSVVELTRELSDLASASLEAALLFAATTLKARYGTPLCAGEAEENKEAAVSIIGLGKLGGRELNFSSDIDILFIYSTDSGETTGIPAPGDSAGSTPGVSGAGVSGAGQIRVKESSVIGLHDYFVKLSTMVSKLLSRVTGDGFVFRVDLDLRPEGRGGPMANSLHSLEVYYETWGQSWERAAMLKARPVAGSEALGTAFLQTVRPFVFRKNLDFTAIEEIKTMKEKIDLSLLRRSSNSIDVKLGTGGIREIEFFCQALQLIHAGKDETVRSRNTLEAIKTLEKKGYIKEKEATTLTDGYIFLRRLEHRIQIVEGRQTQAIPASQTELIRLARMMGFCGSKAVADHEAFWKEYRKITASVHAVYKTLFYKSEKEAMKVPQEFQLLFNGGLSEDEIDLQLKEFGFTDTEEAMKTLALLKKGPGSKQLGARAKLLLDRLGPRFIELASTSPEPNRALKNLERFLSVIGARTAYYSLLAENPRVLTELIKLFGTSEFLSSDLIRHPENLDILLSAELSIPKKSKEELTALFADNVLYPDNRLNYEGQLDALRRLKSQELFRIGLNDISGALNVNHVPEQMTLVAEAALEIACTVGREELARLYGTPAPETRFAVIGLGKLGGRELIYGSDLDILFLYRVPPDIDANEKRRMTTGGNRSISHHDFFAKLCTRILSVLTLRTREGIVFPTDTRIRPSGNAGPLAVLDTAIIKYHAGSTAIWERQAYTRARVVAGDMEFGEEVLGKVKDEIYSRGLSNDDISEMLRIRVRMEREISKENSEQFNIKSGAGGLVDIEFLAQAMQLAYGKKLPESIRPDTLGALAHLAEADKLPFVEYEFLKETYLFYRLLETRLRIVHDRAEGLLKTGTEELDTLARSTGYRGKQPGATLLEDYRTLSAKVRVLYLKTLEGLKD